MARETGAGIERGKKDCKECAIRRFLSCMLPPWLCSSTGAGIDTPRRLRYTQTSWAPGHSALFVEAELVGVKEQGTPGNDRTAPAHAQR
jgi:hypothetical protein